MRPILGLVSTAAFLAAFFMAAAAGASGAVVCGDRATIIASLKKTYSETPVSIGLASNGAVIEILASPTRTFTIILIQPNGLSCVMAAGENWQDLTKVIAGTKIGYVVSVDSSTLRVGVRVAFRGFCRDLDDAFRLARLYDADDSAAAAYAFFESRDNSCVRKGPPQVGIMRERVSARYVIDGKRTLAHIWRVEAANGEMVFVIVAEDPRGRRKA